MAHTNVAKSKNAFEHVLARLAESILFVALGQTIAFYEAKMLCLKENLLLAEALVPKVNSLLAKTILQKAALLVWSALGLAVQNLSSFLISSFVVLKCLPQGRNECPLIGKQCSIF